MLKRAIQRAVPSFIFLSFDLDDNNRDPLEFRISVDFPLFCVQQKRGISRKKASQVVVGSEGRLLE